MTRKAIAIMLILLCSVFQLFAVTISGEGRGDTEQEAMYAAQVDLASQINSSIQYAVGDQTVADTYGLDYQGFSAQSVSTGTFSFLNLQWDSIRKSGGEYVATCHIDSSQTNLYLDAYNSTVEAVNSIHSSLGPLSGEGKRLAYESLITALQEYENYRTLLTVISPETYLETPAVTSALSVQYEYMAYLESEINSNQVAVNAYESSPESFSSAFDRRQYEAALADFENYQESLNRVRLQVAQSIPHSDLESMEEIRNSMLSQAQTASDREDFNEVNDDSISYYVNQIESNKMLFEAYRENLDHALSDIESNYSTAIEELESLVVGDGRSSNYEYVADAELRNDLYRKELERISKEYGELATDTYKQGVEQLEELRDETDRIVRKMNRKTFDVDSTTSTIVFSVDSFVEAEALFKGTAYVVVGSGVYSFDVELPYEDVTGNKWRTPEDLYEYKAQQQAIDGYIDLFTSYPGLFSIEAKVRVTGAVNSYEYAVNVEEYRIIDNSKDRTIVRNRENHGTYLYISSIDMDNFSVPHHALVDPDEYIEYEDDHLVLVNEEDGSGGTVSSLERQRNNSFERIISSGPNLFIGLGGYVGLERAGIPIGVKSYLPVNIADLNLFLGVYGDMDISFPWKNDGKDRSEINIEAGLVLVKTTRKGLISGYEIGPLYLYRTADNTHSIGVHAGLLRSGFEIYLNWYTKPLDQPEWWASLDLALGIKLSIPLSF